MRPAARSLPGVALDAGRRASRITRSLPEETAVALVYDGTTQAVMMASPADLEDFAVGFSLTEGIVARPCEIETLEVVDQEQGVEARMWLTSDRAEALGARRRAMAGPVGCGLCGIDSLEQAIRPLPRVVPGGVPPLPALLEATETLRHHQALHDLTHAVHAAGFMDGEGRIVTVREDVGRHNALDKLIGAIARAGKGMANGAIVLTSRISVEMVQKTALAGCPVIVAVSAPTAHAVRLAEGAGITLAAFARGGALDLYSCFKRYSAGGNHVA